MKLEDYIKQLQDLYSKHDNVDVEFKTICECDDLNLTEILTVADKPYYDEDNNCIVVHEDFVRFDD